MRQTFTLTTEQERLLDAAGERVFNAPTRDGVVPHPNAVSLAWDDLGRQLGFDPDTVEFINPTFFTLGTMFTAEVKQ